MKIFPILNVNQFPAGTIEEFYANDFVNHIESHHKFITKPHKHDFYLTVFFTQGTGVHEIDFNSYEIKRGSIFMLNPGQTHNWVFSEETEGYIFFHTKSFYDLNFSNKSVDQFPFFYSLQNSPCLYLEPIPLKLIEQLFKDILAEYKSARLLKREKICSLVDILYIEVSRAYIESNQSFTTNPPNQYLARIKQLEQLIDEHYLRQKSASTYAEMMHISIKHLNRITQSVLGKTTSDLINERIVLEAKRMLAQSKANVSEVADTLGYEDYSYFSRFFKKNCGVSPSEFAKRYH
jgi:AraC family transcriptional activator of pobA